MEIKKTLIKEEKLKNVFEVVIPAELVKKALDARLEDMQKTYQIPGFRPGKVSMETIKKKESLTQFMHIGEREIEKAVDQIVKETGLDLIAQPKVDLKKFELDSDICFTLELEFFPEMKDFNLSDIKLDKYIIEAKDEDIDRSIQSLVTSYKNFVEQPDDFTASLGDAVKINYLGKIDGKAFEGGAAKDYQLELGSHTFIDTFEDQLIDKKAGDKLVVSVKFPHDYHIRDFCDKIANFDVEVLKVLKNVPLEVNDENIKKAFNLEGLDKLKELIREQINKNGIRYSLRQFREAFVKYIKDKVTVDLPESLVEQCLSNLRQDTYIDKAGSDKNQEEDKKAIEENLRKQAEDEVKIGLVIGIIIRKNNITVNDDEVNQCILEEALSRPGYERNILDMYKKNKEAYAQISNVALEKKVMDFVSKQVCLNEIKVGLKEFEDLLEKK